MPPLQSKARDEAAPLPPMRAHGVHALPLPHLDATPPQVGERPQEVNPVRPVAVAERGGRGSRSRSRARHAGVGRVGTQPRELRRRLVNGIDHIEESSHPPHPSQGCPHPGLHQAGHYPVARLKGETGLQGPLQVRTPMPLACHGNPHGPRVHPQLPNVPRVQLDRPAPRVGRGGRAGRPPTCSSALGGLGAPPRAPSRGCGDRRARQLA